MARVEWTRLRWRLRGATMWPVFVVLTLVEGVLFDALPFSGDGPDGIVPGLLLATALNLVVVAVLAPLAGALLRRRRPDLPRPIAADHCGTGLLAALFAGLVLAGAANPPASPAQPVHAPCPTPPRRGSSTPGPRTTAPASAP